MLFFFCMHIALAANTRRKWLVVIEYDSLKETLEKSRKGVNTKFTGNKRSFIGKYTTINVRGAAVRKFRKSYPHLKFEESQTRALRKKYLEKKGPNVDKEIGTLERSRRLILETVDEKVCNFLQIVRRKGGRRRC